MKFECAHVDTCLCGYWPGHHLPYVQIPVYRGMTMKEIKSAIMDEIRMGYIMGNTEEARMLSADMVNPEEEKQADKVTKAAYAAVNRMRPIKKGQRKFFLDLEEVSDDYDEELVYAYFVFVEI